MFDKYPFKLKFKLLLVVFVMLSIAAYRRSFSGLIEVVRENNSLTEKVGQMGNKTKNADKLRREIATLDKLIGKEGISKDKVQQGIIAFVSEKSNGISINDLQAIHEYADENYKIYTYQLDLIGNFNQLIQLAYNFEKTFDYSKIVSLDFYTEKKSNQNEVLHLKIIFQNYENNK